jgi:hypothetical protein
VIHGRYHVIAGGVCVIALLGGAVAAQTPWLHFGIDDKGPDLAHMDAIEVTVARPAKQAKQPQKQHREAVHTQEQGLAHDDKKPPDPKKPDEQKPAKPDDPTPGPAAKPGDDEPVGKPTVEAGKFNPNTVGNADVDSGDPYLQDVVKDVLTGWEYPKILNAGGVPLGCVQLDLDGKVLDIHMKEKSGNGELDDSVERSLKLFKETRNKHPQSVPNRGNLRDMISAWNGWICFRFKV